MKACGESPPSAINLKTPSWQTDLPELHKDQFSSSLKIHGELTLATGYASIVPDARSRYDIIANEACKGNEVQVLLDGVSYSFPSYSMYMGGGKHCFKTTAAVMCCITRSVISSAAVASR